MAKIWYKPSIWLNSLLMTYWLPFFYIWRRITFEIGEEEEVFGGRYFLHLFWIVTKDMKENVCTNSLQESDSTNKLLFYFTMWRNIKNDQMGYVTTKTCDRIKCVTKDNCDKKFVMKCLVIKLLWPKVVASFLRANKVLQVLTLVMMNLLYFILYLLS